MELHLPLILVLSALGFLVSAGVHLLTFAGLCPHHDSTLSRTLHLGVAGVFILFAVISRTKRSKTAFAPVPSEWNLRSPIAIAFGLFVLYVVFNFFYNQFVQLEIGVPTICDGQEALVLHGKVVKDVSMSAYHLSELHWVRSMSGHWMLFYGVFFSTVRWILRQMIDRKEKDEPSP